MKAFLSKMAAAVTMRQEQPPTNQLSDPSQHTSAPVSQSPLNTTAHQAPVPNSMAMPKLLLPPLREVTMLTPVMLTQDDFSKVH